MATQYFSPPQAIRPSDMKLGDLVRMKINEHTPWSTCIVKQINVQEKWVRLFRPYGHCADFSCTSGVICYIGVEDYKIERADHINVWVIMERPDELK